MGPARVVARNALATVGPAAVEESALASATLFTARLAEAASAPPTGRGGAAGDATATAPPPLPPGRASAWPTVPPHLGTDHVTGGEYFTATRVGRAWRVRTRPTDVSAGNTLTVDLERRRVRIADHPRLREIGRFKYLALFGSEPYDVPPTQYDFSGRSRRTGVVVKLYFRDHYPLEVFRVAAPPSPHPEFDSRPLLAEAEDLCTWLNALLQEDRRRERGAAKPA